MTANLVFGDKEIAEAIKVYLDCTKKIDCRVLFFGKEQSLSSEILLTDIWLIEAMHHYRRPEGFQLGKKLALSGKRVLLFFSYQLPGSIKNEGHFWTIFHSRIFLSAKIDHVLQSPLPSKEDFEFLEYKWPVLAERLTVHHRRVG